MSSPIPESPSVASDQGARDRSIVAVTERHAKALAHPTRVRILVELNKRPMSPAQFAGQTGIPVENATKHFRRLEELGCIELIEQRTERGRVHHVFRAIQRALFDDSSWAALLADERKGVTGAAFSTYIERVEQAAVAGTLDARSDRHFTWTALRFDEIGWRSFLPVIDTLFWLSLELRVQAAARLAKTGAAPIPVTVSLACFESPALPGEACARRADPSEIATDPETVVSPRLSKAMAHPLRIRILVELNKRPMSCGQFRASLGADAPSKRYVERQFKMLEELKCLEQVAFSVKRPGKRRGATERMFRATQRSLFDDSAWEVLPASLKTVVTSFTFTTFIDRVAEAARAGTLDLRPDRHFTWTALHYDQTAWDEFIPTLKAALSYAFQVADESADRLRCSGGEPIPVTVAMACFESPLDAAVSNNDVLESFRTTMRRDVSSEALALIQGNRASERAPSAKRN